MKSVSCWRTPVWTTPTVDHMMQRTCQFVLCLALTCAASTSPKLLAQDAPPGGDLYAPPSDPLVVDKLEEFSVISGGRLSFSVVDPSKDEELAERIAAKGIRPFQVQTIDRDAMGIKLVYSALEISRKRSALEKVLIPETVDAHRDRLLRSGFRSAAVWLRYFNFVSIIAIR